jgi:hypothetical protein
VFVMDCCCTYAVQAERFRCSSNSAVKSVACLCKIMQALGLIISHCFVDGVVAHGIGGSLEDMFSPSVEGCSVSNRQDVCWSECSLNVKKKPNIIQAM